MDRAEFDALLERAIPRRAAKWVERGIWTQERALETARKNLAKTLPAGLDTPGNHFLKVLSEEDGRSVGEVWYSTEEEGGKVQFWVEWIEIYTEHRRKGYASEVLQRLEEAAARLGADRIGLTVWNDNPNALRLYSKLGYLPANMNLTKRLPGRS